MTKITPKSCFFVSPLDSFQQQVMTKSETRLGFKLLGNHYCIKRKIGSYK